MAPVEFRPLRSCPHSTTAPFAPKQQGPRACGSAAGYTVPSFTTAGCSVNSATGSVPLFEMVPLRCRLRGATSRLGCRPARRVPTRRCVFPPPIVHVFGKIWCCLPSQCRWSANEHNAELCAAQKACCSLRRIISIMCKLPSLFLSPARPPVRPQGGSRFGLGALIDRDDFCACFQFVVGC